MKQLIQVERLISKVDSVKCDRCDKNMVVERDSKDALPLFTEGSPLKFSFGYGSAFDCEDWQYDLCDGCCDALRDWIARGVS